MGRGTLRGRLRSLPLIYILLRSPELQIRLHPSHLIFNFIFIFLHRLLSLPHALSTSMQTPIDTADLPDMPFNDGPDSAALPFDHPSHTQQYTAMKGPDPLSSNWTYDSVIYLFSANPMMPDPFSMDLPSKPIDLDPAYFPVDPSAAPELSGFAIPNRAEDAVSCQSPSVRYLAREHTVCA